MTATPPYAATEEMELGLDTSVEGADEGGLEVSTGSGSVALDKADRGLAELHRWYQNGRLIVDPEWQRMYVWDRKRAAKLIESILADIPIPVIYLAKTAEGKYEVIDGLQRLTSIFEFFEGKYALSGLEILREHEGRTFKQLPIALQGKLEDSTLRTFELQPQTAKDLMFVIFERLNTGGKPLNDMEIRNCLYRGKLNTLLKGLASNSDFRSCLNQKSLEKRMDDRLLVLRFLAFYERTYTKARTGLKKFLNDFFETYRDAPDEKLREFEKVFSKAMKASLTVFGDHGFRILKTPPRGGDIWSTRLNASVFQIVAVSFADPRYEIGQLTRRADAIFEEYVDLISSDPKWIDSVKAATGDYNRIEYAFSTWNDRLAKAIGNAQPNDSVRCFSKALKDELFRLNQTCAICGQSISLVVDAALDHDIHYWRGGRTIPENARLVHRLCNQKRGGR
jgi:hypothetical protein